MVVKLLIFNVYPVYNQISLFGNFDLISAIKSYTSFTFCGSSGCPPLKVTPLTYGLLNASNKYSFAFLSKHFPALKSHVSGLKQP